MKWKKEWMDETEKAYDERAAKLEAKKQEPMQIATNILQTNAEKEIEYIKKVYEAKVLAVDRIMTLIPRETSLFNIKICLELLHTITEAEKQPDGSPEGTNPPATNNWFTQINQLILSKGEKTKGKVEKLIEEAKIVEENEQSESKPRI